MTAAAKRMATANALTRQPTALAGTVFLQSFHGILRTSRHIAAARRNQRTDCQLVKADKCQQYRAKHGFKQAQKTNKKAALPSLRPPLIGQHQLVQLAARFGSVFTVKRQTHPHHKIARLHQMLVATKPLTDYPLHKIAFIGTFGNFLCHHQTQTRVPQTVVARIQHLQQMPRTLFSQRKNGRKIFRFQ